MPYLVSIGTLLRGTWPADLVGVPDGVVEGCLVSFVGLVAVLELVGLFVVWLAASGSTKPGTSSFVGAESGSGFPTTAAAAAALAGDAIIF